ncbi:MAG: YmaF family protein [Oscillospiraceae bacterium]|nr:YmaF family protein [Oscillospiraceae bacterium]
MKIYSNPNFPRPCADTPQRSAPRRGQFDTSAFVAALSARNTRALEQLRIETPRAKAPVPPTAGTSHVHQVSGKIRSHTPHFHCFSGTTGPPIPAPGGHVHTFHGTTKTRHRENE